MTAKLVYAVISAVLGSGFQHGFHTGIVNILGTVFIQLYKDLDKGPRDYPIIPHRNGTNDSFWNSSHIRHTRSAEDDWFTDNSDRIKYYGLLWSVSVALFPLGAFLGGILVSPAANSSGRKMTLLWSGGIVLLGLFFQLLGLLLRKLSGIITTITLFLLGRFIIGIYVGLNSGVCPIFLVEIAPDHLRGVAGSAYPVMVSFGIFFAQILTLPDTTGTIFLLGVAIGVAFIPSILQMAFLIWIPESPKFLFITKGDEEEADEALTWLRNTWDVDDELDDLREEATALDELEDTSCGHMCDDQTLRSPLIICMVIMIGHQFCGAYVFFYYSNSLLIMCGFINTASYITLGMGATNLVIAVAAMFLVDILGRKPLILLSFAGMTFATIALIITLELMQKNLQQQDDFGITAAVFMFIFIILFAMGAGSIPWFITPELHNHNYRPMATGIVVTVGWLMHFVFAMTCYVTFDRVSYFIFIFYCVASVVTFVFLAFTMRETMDLTAIDIIELFYD